MQNAFDSELTDKGVILAETLAESISRQVIDNNVLAVTEVLRKIATSTKNLEYIYIIGFEDQFFAHTFKNGVPRILLDAPHPDRKNYPAIKRYFLQKQPVFDVAYPLIKGLRAHIHIGMNESFQQERYVLLRKQILYLSTVVILLGILLSFFISRRIINPMKKLKESVDNFGKGTLEGFTEIRSSAPEIYQLSKSFNAMVERRKEVEQMLKESENRFRQLAENIQEVFWLVSPDWQEIIYVSPAYEKIWGKSRQSLYARPSSWIESVMEGERESVLADIKKKGAGDLSAEEFPEYRIMRPDGSVRWIAARAYPVKDKNDTIIRIAGIAEDITERKEAEKALRESEKKYRSIMDAMDDATFICTLDFQIAYMNPAMITRVGRDYTGEPCFKSIHGLDVVCPWCDLDQVMKGNSLKTEIKSPLDGQDFNISSSPIQHSNGSISKLTVLRNVTEVKKIESRLQQAQKMEAIGSLAGGIAHDFNNILFPIVGMSEMLFEDLADKKTEQQYAREIFKAGKRASALVQQILAFSRKTEHKTMPIKLQSVLKEVLTLCRSTIPSDIEIAQSIQHDCRSVKADSTQIHQVAMNLITNAYHAVEEKSGRICVLLKEFDLSQGDLPESLLKPGRYVQFTVSDTGCGIEPGVMDKIFEPYFTTKEQGKGTGLGLATVYGIVKEYQGDITVYSELGKGTTFNVFLPGLKKTDEAEFAIEPERMQTGTERILIVDDEEPIANLEKIILEKLGYNVTSFTSSIEALKAFQSDPKAYDLIITDMTMPQMTGDLFSRKVKGIRPDIPILICTGFSERINPETIEAIGADEILMKPIARAKLSKKVHDLLDKKSFGI